MAERTLKQIAAGQRRSLLSQARKLRELGYRWADMDECNGTMLDQLADYVEATAYDLYTGEES